MPHELAVVIPAYKDVYLNNTLQSLSLQTDKNFSVYIGDDNSPYNLEQIVSKYINVLNITYKRFDKNLGGSNLVLQWNRCLELMQGEEYFCMFSDDDLMEPTCIEQFRKSLIRNSNYDVFHFDINIINGNGEITTRCNEFPRVLSADKFLLLLYTYQIDARMPEFIFRTRHFHESGGFINFDLAYRSDNATVVANAKKRDIYTIPHAKVLWRDSGINVSSSQNDALKIRRTYASIDFFNWLEDYYTKRSEICPLHSKRIIKQVISDILDIKDCVPKKELYQALKKSNRIKRNYFLYLRYKYYMINKIRKQKK